MTTNLVCNQKQFALLVGINYYPDQNNRLKGCCWDVQAMAEFLKISTDGKVNLAVLTASDPKPGGSLPPEKPEELPTFINVLTHTQRIIESANPGDQVLFQFAGHGTRQRASKENNSEELALVFLFEDRTGLSTKVWRGRSLAAKFQEMHRKGLKVTLILDCCFSGAIFRGPRATSTKVRFMDSIENGIFKSDFLEAKDPRAESSHWREGAMDPKWLCKPEGYTVLTACAPHEEAYELVINGQVRGIFSHFLLGSLHSLSSNGLQLTHRLMHTHLHANLHAFWPRQTPMRYGVDGKLYIGSSISASDVSYHPIFISDGKIFLRAGNAHGVFEGDIFHAAPYETENSVSAKRNQESVILKVASLGAFTSEMTVIKNNDHSRVKTGWKAELITCLSPLVVTIGLDSSIMDKSTSRLIQRGRYMQLVSIKNKESGQDDIECVFHVLANKQNEYELRDSFQLPVFPIQSIPDVLLTETLEHVSQYKYFENIENRTVCRDLSKFFWLKMNNNAAVKSRVQLKNGESLEVTFGNAGECQLYVAIFNFTQSWQIKSLLSDSGFIVVPAKKDGIDGEVRIRITMEIPQYILDSGRQMCEDLFKIFITTEPTHFRLELPSIFDTLAGKHASSGRDNGDSLASKLESFQRGPRLREWITRSIFVSTGH